MWHVFMCHYYILSSLVRSLTEVTPWTIPLQEDFKWCVQIRDEFGFALEASCHGMNRRLLSICTCWVAPQISDLGEQRNKFNAVEELNRYQNWASSEMGLLRHAQNLCPTFLFVVLWENLVYAAGMLQAGAFHLATGWIKVCCWFAPLTEQDVEG